MKALAPILVLIGALTPAVAAQDQEEDYQPLLATYKLRGPTIIDPVPGEKKDRVAFFITGEAARRMYQAMHATPREICGDSNIRQKKAGDLECQHYQDKNDYMCDVAIVLDTGKTAKGEVC